MNQISQVSEARRNWARNHTFAAARVHTPQSVAEVQRIVAGSGRVGVMGSGHSFNDIADTPGDLLALERMNQIISLDPQRRIVTVEAGIKYGALCVALHERGWAVHNTASLPHISVAGACATATHGSGDKNGNLSTAVAGLEVVIADGSVLSLSRQQDGARFKGAVVGLGALGVVTQLTLDVMPSFQMRQYVYEDLPAEQLLANFDDVMGAGYSVSLFTDWTGPRVNQVWIKARVGASRAPEAGANGANGATGVATGPEGSIPDEDPAALEREARAFTGSRRATGRLHPVARLSAESCTEQLGIVGPWHERLPHFRMDFTPASGAELQSEYFVAREHAVAAFRALDKIREHIAPLLIASEVRSIAADDLWMSTAYGRDTVAFHFSWILDVPPVMAFLPTLEEALAPFDARPHWGKLFLTSAAQLRTLYPRFDAFKALAHELDPGGKFRNAYLDRTVFGS